MDQVASQSASTSLFNLKATGVVYRREYSAPKILIQTKGRRAMRLLQLAEEHGVPIVKNTELSAFISLVPEDFFIPEDLYEIMAITLLKIGGIPT